jgi:hypothetical protein
MESYGGSGSHQFGGGKSNQFASNQKFRRRRRVSRKQTSVQQGWIIQETNLFILCGTEWLQERESVSISSSKELAETSKPTWRRLLIKRRISA